MESFEEVFENVKEYISDKVSENSFRLWIKCLQPYRFEDNVAYFYVKTPFQREIIMKHHSKHIADGFREVMGVEIPFEILTEEDLKGINDVSATASAETEPDSNANLDGTYEYTFETFIIGTSNNFACAACKAVAAQKSGPSGQAYNPLFIYGPSGLGKTHLLSAIKHEIEQHEPKQNVVYVSSEVFTNELIAAIQNKTIDLFHNKYRKADVLLIDDIQFITGKERTQEEFFHTFNELYRDGKQIVLTSDRPPKDIQTLEDRLKSRFESGLLTDIQPPDYETRIAIINRKASLMHIDISREVSEYIANRLKTNIRQLEGVVKKLSIYQMLNDNLPPTVSMAQTAIKEILNDNQPLPVTVERIIEEVAKTYSVTADDIRSSKRSSQISQARQTAIYVVREVTQMSMDLIGDEFGGRDHSTIVYALKKVKEQMDTDSRQKSIVEDIIKNIKSK